MSFVDDLNFSTAFISAKDFDNEPMKLKITAKAELVESKDPKYGFQAGHEHVGKTVQYSFNKGVLNSTSVRLMNEFNRSGAEVGDWISIKRELDGTNTQYEVKKIDEPENANEDFIPKEDDLPPLA